VCAPNPITLMPERFKDFIGVAMPDQCLRHPRPLAHCG
jgi:hypothetical protein